MITLEEDQLKEAGGVPSFLQTIPLVADQPYYDLSNAQAGHWLMYSYLKNPGPFNSLILEQLPFMRVDAALEAGRTLIARHSLFRSTFVNVDGVPKQQIHAPAAFAASITFEPRTGEAAPAVVESLTREARDYPFDFRTGPLFYIKVVQTRDNFIFLLNMHHVLTDAWSNAVIRQEIFELYRCCARNAPLSLPPPRIQFTDYVYWHKALYSKEMPASFKKYWFRYTSRKLPEYDLSSFFSARQPAAASYRERLIEQVREHLKPMRADEEALFFGVIGKVEMKESAAFRFVVDAATHERLKELALATGATLFNVILYGFNLLIYRLTGSRDSIIGVNVATRNNEDLKNLIGFMVNTVLIRNEVVPSASLAAGLAATKDALLDALDFTFYPFERIMDDFDLAFESVSKVFINMPNKNKGELSFIKDFTAGHLDDTFRTGYFDLDVHVNEQKNGIEIICEYKKDILRPEQMEYLHRELLGVFSQLACHPGLPASALRPAAGNPIPA